MNFNKHELFDLLTSCTWESGTARKMLFLKRRYYVFDADHKLIDGGIIRYNKTLEKIFIRNEDLRGEVFLSLEDENKIHLTGAVFSKLAGQINIDNILTPYEHALRAPLSRVAKVEKYLTSKDIYEILRVQKEVDEVFLKTYEKSMHAFSPEQARELYIKVSPLYFKKYEIRVLKTISLYFSSTPSNEKLYEELFMFLMGFQMAYENELIQVYDVNYFISSVKQRLLLAYDNSPLSISTNMINEALLYFHIDSAHLPSLQTCIKKLYDKDLSVQEEYAYYLSLMDAKSVEDEVLNRLVDFYQEKFFIFRAKVKRENFKEIRIKKTVTELSTQLALIKTLGNCKSANKEVHLFLLFLFLNHDERVQKAAKKAFSNIKDKALKTFKSLNLQEEIKHL